jgi:hypothetical protein
VNGKIGRICDGGWRRQLLPPFTEAGECLEGGEGRLEKERGREDLRSFFCVMFSIRFPAQKKTGQREKGSMVFCARGAYANGRASGREGRENETQRYQKHSV